jgi:hypothetical protein
MKKNKIFVIFVLFAMASQTLAGNYALEFLNIPVSPIVHTFGGNPVLETPMDIVLNPALISERTRPEISTALSLWIEDIRVQHFSLSFPFYFGFSLSGMYLSADYGQISGYGILDNSLGDVKTGSSIGGFGISREFGRFLLGAGYLKIRDSLSSEDCGNIDALTFGVKSRILFLDLGASFFLPSGKISYGVDSLPQDVPKIKRFGVSARISKFLLEAGFISPGAETSLIVYGLEAKIVDSVKLRVGSNSDSSAFGTVFGIEFAFGNVFIGYSFSPAVLDNTVNSLSFTMKFGGSNLKRRLLKQGKKLFNQGYYEKARKKFDEVIILDPENVTARFFIAKISEILSPSSVAPTEE